MGCHRDHVRDPGGLKMEEMGVEEASLVGTPGLRGLGMRQGSRP